MTKYCAKPDVDVPKLQCGHPIPCPRHTVVLKLASERPDDVADAVANLRWVRLQLLSTLNIHVANRHPDGGEPDELLVKVTCVCANITLPDDMKNKVLERWLPLGASIVEIRNAIEELQIEARAWLETHRK